MLVEMSPNAWREIIGFMITEQKENGTKLWYFAMPITNVDRNNGYLSL